MKTIAQIQNNLILDNLKYFEDFSYENSPYASMDFPEVGSVNLFGIVDLPNKNSSQETLSELKYISRVTINRTKEDIDLVYLVDEDPLLLFYPLIKELGLEFNEQLFRNIYNNCVIAIIDHLKYFYNRARPFQLAELLDIPIDRIITKTHHTPSYPSGHTFYASLAANILIDDYPEHKSIFESLVKKTGYARVLQGVHYPSDNNASIKIMNTIFPNLKKYFSEI